MNISNSSIVEESLSNCGFFFSLRDPKNFSKFIDSLFPLLEDFIFEVSKDGLQLIQANTTHALLVEFYAAPNSSFFNFQCDDEVHVICLKMKDFHHLLKLTASSDTIKFRGGKQSDELLITVLNQNGFSKTVTLKTLSIVDYAPLNIPDIRWENQVRMKSVTIDTICNHMKGISSEIRISLFKNSIEFFCKNDNAKIHLKVENTKEMCFEVEEEGVSILTKFEYFKILSKISTLSSEIIIGINEDQPFSICFKIQNVGDISFYVAPLLE